jgi:hypothetical protein
MPSGGAYLPTSMVNQVYLLADGQHALAVYPNGRAADIGNLVLVDLANTAVTLVTAGVLVDNALDGPAAHIAFSPDGRFAAYISATANDEHFIHRLTLDGTYQPVTTPAGQRGDVIGMFAFSPDGSLVFTAGGIDGQDNSLFVLPADAVEARRVLRGRYIQNAGLALDGAAILLAYVPPDDNYGEPAADLVQIAFDETQTVLLEGRAAGMVSYPLAIR